MELSFWTGGWAGAALGLQGRASCWGHFEGGMRGSPLSFPLFVTHIPGKLLYAQTLQLTKSPQLNPASSSNRGLC